MRIATRTPDGVGVVVNGTDGDVYTRDDARQIMLCLTVQDRTSPQYAKAYTMISRLLDRLFEVAENELAENNE